VGTVALHIVPRARVTAVAGSHGDAVKIRVAAPPVDGAANAELVRFLAARLNVPTARVTIVGGASGRRKTVAVEGMQSQEIQRTLLALVPR
jgi:uncharacterized protein (TIGR00251 family)